MFAQKLKIVTAKGQAVEVVLLSESERSQLIEDQNGHINESLRMPRTARTYELLDDRILIELFDRQGVLVAKNDMEKLHGIRFFKPYIDFIRRNVSYRIDLPY
jgi:hypothetical protein